MSQITVLYHLQQLDTQIDHLKSQLAEINRKLSDDASVKNAQAAQQQAHTDLKVQQKALKNAEDAVKAQQIKIQETEGALYGGRIHVPKELQDLQKEIISLKKYLDVLETTQLDEMLKTEAAEAELKTAENAVQQSIVQSMEKNGALNGQKMTSERDLSRSISEKQAISSSLTGEDLEVYERLRKTKRGIAVASLISGTCSACGSMLTPADRQLARAPSHLFLCLSCGRIIYAG